MVSQTSDTKLQMKLKSGNKFASSDTVRCKRCVCVPSQQVLRVKFPIMFTGRRFYTFHAHQGGAGFAIIACETVAGFSADANCLLKIKIGPIGRAQVNQVPPNALRIIKYITAGNEISKVIIPGMNSIRSSLSLNDDDDDSISSRNLLSYRSLWTI